MTADRRQACTVTIKLLELLAIVVTPWSMLELVGDRPNAAGDPITWRQYRGLHAVGRGEKRRF